MMETIANVVTEAQIIYVATDWSIFWATLGAGILTAIATVLAVVLTNKKTAERYEQDKERQEKTNAMVVLKPMIKFTSFGAIIGSLIRNDIWERVLLISGEDGFSFFDDMEDPRYEWSKIFSLKNGVYFKDVNSLLIKTSSVLISESGERTEYKTSNFIDLLRSMEEVVFRMYGTEQRIKIKGYEEKRERFTLDFKVDIDYLTLAGQQVKYEYEAKIVDIPKSKEVDGVNKEYYDFRTEILKDGYAILDEVTIPKNQKATAFRNLQDNAQVVGDRAAYRNEMSGREQGRAMVAELGGMLNKLPDIISWIFTSYDKSTVTSTEEISNGEPPTQLNVEDVSEH